jgi:hypothetical protein
LSHVEALRNELNQIADGYSGVQELIENLERDAKTLQTRWSQTGLTSRTPYFDMNNAEIAEFHKTLSSLSPWAFNISAQVSGMARRL